MAYHTTQDETIRQNSQKVLFKALNLTDAERQTI